MGDKQVSASGAVNIAEYRLLNACINNPKWLEDPRVTRDSFVHSIPVSIFDGLVKLKTDNVPATPYALLQAVADTDINVQIGTIDTIFDLKQGDLESIDDIVGTLDRSKRQIKVSQDFEKISQQLSNVDADVDEAEGLVAQALQGLQQLATGIVSKTMTLGAWLSGYLEKFPLRKGRKLYPFGNALFDEMIVKGAQPGDIGLIVSATGQGKSTSCLDIVRGLVRIEIPSMYFSLEMGEDDTMDRWISAKYGIPFKDIVNPSEETFPAVKKMIEKEYEEMHEYNLFRFSDSPTLSLLDLRKEVMAFQKDIGQQYCVVVIDLLSQIVDFCKNRPGMTFAQSIEMAVNELHRIAKELHIHIIGVLQFNRNADSAKVVDFEDLKLLRPNLNDIKNAQAFAERARYVVGLFRAKYYAKRYLEADHKDEVAAMPDQMEYMFLKQNNGNVGSRFALFDGETFTITPILDSNEKPATGE